MLAKVMKVIGLKPKANGHANGHSNGYGNGHVHVTDEDVRVKREALDRELKRILAANANQASAVSKLQRLVSVAQHAGEPNGNLGGAG